MAESAKRSRRRTTSYGRPLTVRLDDETWAALQAMHTVMEENREPSAKPTTWSDVVRMAVLEGSAGIQRATERAAVDPAALAKLDELAERVAAAEKQTRLAGYGLNALVKTLRTTSQKPDVAAALADVRQQLEQVNDQLARLVGKVYGGAPWR